jgi:hypothetical protein
VADIEREIEKIMQQSLDSTQRSCQQLDSSNKLAEQSARVYFIFRIKNHQIQGVTRPT